MFNFFLLSDQYKIGIWLMRQKKDTIFFFKILGFCFFHMLKTVSRKKFFTHYLIWVVIHIVIHLVVGFVVIELRLVGSYTSDNGVFDLHPLASYVWWFVCVAGACDVVSWEWLHFECFAILLHIAAGKVIVGSATVDVLFPRQKFVGNIVHCLKLWAFFFGVAKIGSILDLVWLPFVLTYIWAAFLCFALNWSGWPNVLLSVFTNQVAELFSLLFVWFTSTFRLHTIKWSKNFSKIWAWCIFI